MRRWTALTCRYVRRRRARGVRFYRRVVDYARHGAESRRDHHRTDHRLRDGLEGGLAVSHPLQRRFERTDATVQRLHSGHADAVRVDHRDLPVGVPEPERRREVLRHRSQMPNGFVVEPVGPGTDRKGGQPLQDFVGTFGRRLRALDTELWRANESTPQGDAARLSAGPAFGSECQGSAGQRSRDNRRRLRRGACKGEPALWFSINHDLKLSRVHFTFRACCGACRLAPATNSALIRQARVCEIHRQVDPIIRQDIHPKVVGQLQRTTLASGDFTCRTTRSGMVHVCRPFDS